MDMEHATFLMLSNKSPGWHIGHYNIFQLTTNLEFIKDKFHGIFWTFISLVPIMTGALWTFCWNSLFMVLKRKNENHSGLEWHELE